MLLGGNSTRGGQWGWAGIVRQPSICHSQLGRCQFSSGENSSVTDNAYTAHTHLQDYIAAVPVPFFTGSALPNPTNYSSLDCGIVNNTWDGDSSSQLQCQRQLLQISAQFYITPRGDSHLYIYIIIVQLCHCMYFSPCFLSLWLWCWIAKPAMWRVRRSVLLSFSWAWTTKFARKSMWYLPIQLLPKFNWMFW